jgi:two-component system phosphate regulon sensor histidine kinase PhoR
MTIITNYREEVTRFENLISNKPSASKVKLTESITEKSQPPNMVNAAANSLRSPLLALKIYLDLLKNFPQEEKKTDVLNRMKLTTNEMAKKINALSTLVNVQNETNPIKEKINFSNILEDVKTELSAKFDLSDITFTTNFIEPSIQANSSEISLLLSQILHNSITYRHNKKPLHIKLKTKKVGGYILFGIKDNGIGMVLKNDEETNKLFRPFYRLNNSSEGIGIGLSIVRSIVDKYHGEVKVRSRINEGSMFNIYLKE